MSHGHSHRPGESCGGGGGGPRAGAVASVGAYTPSSSAPELLALADALLKRKSFRLVQGLMDGNSRCLTFRGKALLHELRAMKVKYGEHDTGVADKLKSRQAARAIANELVNLVVDKPGTRPHRLFAKCRRMLADGNPEAEKMEEEHDDYSDSDPEVRAAEAKKERERLKKEKEKREEHKDGEGGDAAAAAASGAAATSAAEKKAEKAEKAEKARERERAAAPSMMRGDFIVFTGAEERKWNAGDKAGRVIFQRNARYAWVYEGASSSHWRLAILVAFVLALCMFPLWPNMVRIWIWYAAVTLLLTLLGVSIVRYLLFSLAWIGGYEFWLFPNFWLSDLPWEMVTPVYTLDKASAGQRWMRLAMVAAAAACVYYVVTAPPSEFEGFLEHQKKLVSDLYAGTLLSDGSDAGGSGGRGAGARDKFAGMGYGRDRKRSHMHNIPDIDSFEEMWREEDGTGTAGAGAGADGAAAGATSNAGAEDVAAAAGAGAAAGSAAPDMDAMLDSHDADADAADARDEA